MSSQIKYIEIWNDIYNSVDGIRLGKSQVTQRDKDGNETKITKLYALDFTYDNCIKTAKERYFRHECTNKFHNKLLFFKILQENGVSCCPKTYLSIKKFDDSENNDNKLWFLKSADKDGGKEVYPFINNNNYNNKLKGNYIVQKGVENLLLYEGSRKFDCRVHVLITRKRQVYVYNECILRISRKKYIYDDVTKDIHVTNGLQGAQAILSSEMGNDFSLLFESIVRSVKEIMECMIKFRDPDGYALLGLDIIFDKNKKAWVLESNNKPSINYYLCQELQININNMMRDMINIVLFNKHNKHIIGPQFINIGV